MSGATTEILCEDTMEKLDREGEDAALGSPSCSFITPKTSDLILRTLPHRGDAVVLDDIYRWSFLPDKRVAGWYVIPTEESEMPGWLLGHFPGHPVMPGVQIIEHAAQIAVVLINLSKQPHLLNNCPLETPESVVDFAYRRVTEVDFVRCALPGDRLYTVVVLNRSRRKMHFFSFRTFCIRGKTSFISARGAFVGASN